MKKEVMEKISKFIDAETDVYHTYGIYTNSNKFNRAFFLVNLRKINYLRSLVNYDGELTPEQSKELNAILADIAGKITAVAKWTYKLDEAAAVARKKTQPTLAVYSAEAIAKQKAMALADLRDSLRSIDKFNKKLNKAKQPKDRKSFISILQCRFKKSKMENEKQEDVIGQEQE